MHRFNIEFLFCRAKHARTPSIMKLPLDPLNGTPLQMYCARSRYPLKKVDPFKAVMFMISVQSRK